MKKVTYLVSLILVSLWTIMVVSATASNRCEFDAVGCDAFNYFNGPRENAVVVNAKDSSGNLINYHSYWPLEGDTDYGEYFYTNLGCLTANPCYSGSGRRYAMAGVFTDGGVWEWRIILQMMPTSDIELEIVDCSLRHNETDVWKYAIQNGWIRFPWGDLFFETAGNVQINVEALPGPLASDEFKEAGSFIMDARTMPGLDIVPLVNNLITSVGLWGTHIMMVMPQEGLINSSGQATHTLHQGDQIRVKFTVDRNWTDLWYGTDSVILKYIGVVGTEYITEDSCEASVTVSYPNGSEELVAGSETKIKWKPEGSMSTVKIWYSVNNGLDWIFIDSVTNNGSYLWTVPSTLSTECLIRVSNICDSNVDISDNTFSIVLLTNYDILDFFDESVADGTLEGDGPGNSANGRLNALRNILEMAGDLINIGDIEGACGQLRAALMKCDGDSPPPDFVSGSAASHLHTMITELMAELGCE